ncbi:hypothetical protein [Mesorhizobium sp.]|uniref:hypothetical protein n=1 Tax=Mesorhizobium sp. TaxID=1871066 RepID=UPI0025BEC556|nr:hypothetical protein [Mesorhizobium sp.]
MTDVLPFAFNAMRRGEGRSKLQRERDGIDDLLKQEDGHAVNRAAAKVGDCPDIC